MRLLHFQTKKMNILCLETGLDPLTSSLVKLKAELGSKLVAVPDEGIWRVKYLGQPGLELQYRS
jgi:hypothetical protein